MTDVAAAPATVADTANAVQQQNTATGTEWMTGIADEIKSAITAKGFKTPADVTQAWYHAQRAIGADKIPAPKDGVWDPVALEKLGVPKDPSGYQIKRPELPAGVTYDENFEKAALPILHKMGIPPAGAQALVDLYAGHVAQQGKAMADQQAAQATETVAALKTEWGKAYDQNIALAGRAVKHFGGDALVEALNTSGAGNLPELIRAMSKVGELLGEDTLKTGQSGGMMLTPAEALAEANKVMNSPEYTHPDKAIQMAAVAKAEALFAQAYPEQAA